MSEKQKIGVTVRRRSEGVFFGREGLTCGGMARLCWTGVTLK
jgi:hypothetical protein